jgi:hypothetical protein
MRIGVLGVLAAGFALAACAIQRAQVADQARQTMIGLTKEQLLACAGPPANQAAVGQTEVWSYNSGNGRSDVVVTGNQFIATANASQRFCTVNVAMTNGRVSGVNYTGPTGGLLTQGEQCAFAVQSCTHQ